MADHPSVAAQKLIKAFRQHRNYETLATAILESAPRRNQIQVFGYAIHYLGNDPEEGALLVAMERVMDKITDAYAGITPIPSQVPQDPVR